MKKIFYILASAIVALGAVACDNQDLDTLNPADGLTISATLDNTKVVFDDELNASWESTDKITIDGFIFVQEEAGIFRCADKDVFEALVGKTKTAVCGTFDSTKGLEGTLFEAEGEIKAQGTSLAFAPANALLLVTAEEDGTILESENFSEDVILNANEPTYVPIMAGEDVTISYYVNFLKTKSLTADFVAGKVYQLGTLKPVEGGEATISFSNDTQRIQMEDSKQIWENEGVKFTNEKASSTNAVANYTNPVRLYANSSITVTAPGNITKIVFDCNSGSYATALKNSITTVTPSVSNDKVTVVLDGTSNTFTIAKLTAQVRMDALTVSYGAALADNRETQTISFPDDEYTVTEGEVFKAPTVEGNNTPVTYSSSDEAIATVDATIGAVTLKGETGRVTITATAAENKNYKGATASYTLVVKSASLAGSGAGTEDDPFDITRAIAKIDEDAELDVMYYAEGTITNDEITFNESYKSLTYYITDGTNKLQVFGGKGLDKANFTAATDLHEGDVVVVCGKLKKYNSTYEFDSNNYLVSRECGHTDLEQTVTFSSTPESVEVGKTVNVSASAINAVTYSSSNTSIATVDANGDVKGIAEGTVTITATAAAGNGYAQATATHTIEVVAAQQGTKKTYTLTITKDDFTTKSYADNNKEHTSTAKATDGTTMTVKWTSNQVYQNSQVMQWQKSNGYIFNSTDLGTITNITVNSTSGTFTTYKGSTSKPTTTNGTGGYFQVKTGSSAVGKTNSIVITFEK